MVRNKRQRDQLACSRGTVAKVALRMPATAACGDLKRTNCPEITLRLPPNIKAVPHGPTMDFYRSWCDCVSVLWESAGFDRKQCECHVLKQLFVSQPCGS